MGGGALMQLIASGAQDVYLTGNPQMTYFRAVYKRHTNFAVESILQNTVGTLKQGSKFAVTIGRNGDLVKNIYVVIKRKAFKLSDITFNTIYTARGGMNYSGTESIPSGNLSGCTRDTLKFYYPSEGYNFLDYVEIEIGGQIIDKHYGDWLNIWTDLCEPLDKKLTLNQMLFGKSSRINSKYDLFTDGDVYLPLKFWFCDNPGLALPLIALQYHEVKLNFSLTTSKYLTDITNGFTIDITGKDLSGEKYEVVIPAEPNIIEDLEVYADYIFLDTAERRKFAKVKHEYLFQQVQTLGPKSISTNSERVTVPLRFNHPVKELIWFIDNTSVGACSSALTNNRTFEVAKTALIQLNGKDRFRERNGSYFTVAQRYQHHSGTSMKYLFETLFSGDSVAFDKNYSQFTASSIPSEAIHLYSFALKPEEHRPSGTCNFSRIDNIVLDLTFYNSSSSSGGCGSSSTITSAPCYYKPTTGNDIPPAYRSLTVFAVNYNILSITCGMGGLTYCN